MVVGGFRWLGSCGFSWTDGESGNWIVGFLWSEVRFVDGRRSSCEIIRVGLKLNCMFIGLNVLFFFECCDHYMDTVKLENVFFNTS